MHVRLEKPISDILSCSFDVLHFFVLLTDQKRLHMLLLIIFWSSQYGARRPKLRLANQRPSSSTLWGIVGLLCAKKVAPKMRKTYWGQASANPNKCVFALLFIFFLWLSSCGFLVFLLGFVAYVQVERKKPRGEIRPQKVGIKNQRENTQEAEKTAFKKVFLCVNSLAFF